MPLNPSWENATIKEQALEDIKNGTSILLAFADVAVRLPGWTGEEGVEPNTDTDMTRPSNLNEAAVEDISADADDKSTKNNIDATLYKFHNPPSTIDVKDNRLGELEAFCQIFIQRKRNENNHPWAPPASYLITSNVMIHANATTVNANAINATVNTASDIETQTQTQSSNENGEYGTGTSFHIRLAGSTNLDECRSDDPGDGLGEIIEPDEMYNDIDSMGDLDDLGPRDDLEDLKVVRSVMGSVDSVETWEVNADDRGDGGDGDDDEEGDSYVDMDSPNLVPMFFVVPALEDDEDWRRASANIFLGRMVW